MTCTYMYLVELLSAHNPGAVGPDERPKSGAGLGRHGVLLVQVRDARLGCVDRVLRACGNMDK